jgi:hypothetical protein
MKKYLYSLVLSTTILSGCGKDKEAPLIVEGRYLADDTILAANPITMYTKDGKVDNQSIIQRFLNHRTWAQSYFSSTDIVNPNIGSSSLAVEIRSNKRAAIISKYSNSIDSIGVELTSQEANYLVLSAIDSFSINVPNYRYDEVHVNELVAQMHTVIPQRKCYNVPAYLDYSQSCKQRYVRLLTTKKGKLFIPQFSYIVQVSQLNYGFHTIGYNRVWNTFNKSVLNKLVVGDTLVVQEREVTLLRK